MLASWFSVEKELVAHTEAFSWEGITAHACVSSMAFWRPTPPPGFHPEPHALHPKPYTLHPTPYTTPYTLNPQPQTPHPKP